MTLTATDPKPFTRADETLGSEALASVAALRHRVNPGRHDCFTARSARISTAADSGGLDLLPKTAPTRSTACELVAQL
ncbi:hypothetical protein [Cryobacterium psychrophilum]|uniref:Uncharacterized protein n=1 Tax=Cryobacterium psychrophilum TaxID=41988 RepID=A0A4Y8KS57_9MICO|nr:hypothetical protein [Cryobacterium psychrophilum]TDW30180.1 hypothetical protein EDD25_1923 [Cryobacterium psychrophilum]TFD77409.1 hypothetical protein E3T53_11325 [Cryobacterium psychrophilum]